MNYNQNKRQFTKEMVNDTLKYQKIYGFKIGVNNKAVDNESDAFRHAYMQAYLSLKFNNYIAKNLGNDHEEIGKISGKEHEEKEEEIDAQLRIYVNSYTRSDGTQLQGYFRTKPRN